MITQWLNDKRQTTATFPLKLITTISGKSPNKYIIISGIKLWQNALNE